MQTLLKDELIRLCRRQAQRRQSRIGYHRRYARKFMQRTNKPAGQLNDEQAYPIDRHFCPKYCAKNANFLARSILHKVKERTYSPKPAILHKFSKPDGRPREVMEFSLPDAALAKVIYRTASKRNLTRFSPNSYAFRPDKTLFDVILTLNGFMSDQRVYVVQFDFEQYFDRISTNYLTKIIRNKEFVSMTSDERFVIDKFLHHQYATRENYSDNNFLKRERGTPQGSSISLLMANLGCHELDLALERKAGRFVRFADDIVALCSRFSEAEEIEATILDHCARSGVKINEKKSRGITVIRKDSDSSISTLQDRNRVDNCPQTLGNSSEDSNNYNKNVAIKSDSGFDFLGYRFTRTGLLIPSSNQKKIISKFSRLIHLHLVHYIAKYGFNKKRSQTTPKKYDWDILGMVMALRGYLYGGVTEDDINSCLKSGRKLPKMNGLMGFYALLESKDDLKCLDKQLKSCVMQAIKTRNKILLSKYQHVGLSPTLQDLIAGTWMDLSAWQSDDPPDTRLPSFVRGWSAARKYYFTFGLEGVQPPKYMYY